MSEFIFKTEDEFNDLVWGATFFGTGGGGAPEEGLRLLKREASQGREIKVVAPEAISDDSWTVCVSFMGNRAPLSDEQKIKMKNLQLKKWKYENNLVEAAKLLESYAQVKISAVVAPELGGANTPGPLAAGVNLGVPVVDGDYAGRAIPEIAQATPCLLGSPIHPIASVDKWGNKTIVCETLNSGIAERIGKMLAVAAFGNTGLAMFLMKAKEMKKLIIRGTITKSYELGKIMRVANTSKEDLIQAVLNCTKGWLLFKGKVIDKKWLVEDGYYVGYHLFEGYDDFKGHSYKVWFKNENHISWYDEKPDVTSPDLICQIDLETGKPITNHELQKGQIIALIGVQAHSIHREDKVVEFLAPKHYGFDIEYVPIEKRLSQTRR